MCAYIICSTLEILWYEMAYVQKNPFYIVSKIFKHHNKFTGTFKVKAGLAQMAKGGIIMDVTTSQEARIAEEAGVMSRDHEYIVYHKSIF